MGDLPEVRPEKWVSAEMTADEIVRKVRPTVLSEIRRRDVVEYIQRLIKTCLGAEVFTYGSVPLKTYLPDGDIDLTVFSELPLDDQTILAEDFKSLLEDEETNNGAEFVVKDVQLIRAEVKLVKCIVDNVVVDVSFHQTGGLSTLCFLEQVDQLIGKDHLFKRSIILIKAWCYYESRILGAHHGLISTYALETLVLYIFHLFHTTLDGPLSVLYKFLDYFSKFDWENYCISLNGPVPISSLPALDAEMPEESDEHLLLSSDFLSACVEQFSDAPRKSRGFQPKHLNIVDLLKLNNNLGRSVSQGNFYRIKGAFIYGARNLWRILMQPDYESMATELHRFFGNTMSRHGGGLRPDEFPDFQSERPVFLPHLRYPNQDSDRDENALADLTGDYETHFQCLMYARWVRENPIYMHSVNMALPPPPPPLPAIYARNNNNSPWDGLMHMPMSHFQQTGFSPINNGFHPSPGMFPVQHMLVPGGRFGWDDVPKPRGTGIYFPNGNPPPQGYRTKGRNQPPSRSPRFNNGRGVVFPDPIMLDNRSIPEIPQPQQPQIPTVNRNQMIDSTNHYPGFSPRENGLVIPQAEIVEFELDTKTSTQQNPAPSSPRILSEMQKSPPALTKDQDRMTLRSSYLLKDEDDFPPLSV